MATTMTANMPATSSLPGKNNGAPVLLDAKYINIKHKRLENEIIPLGPTRVEVVLAEIDLDDLKLDPTNPRITFKLKSAGVTATADEKQLEELLWEDPDVKALKRAIEANGGLIEAIIVSGKDGTVLEGNCRLTSLRKLRAETESKDPRWLTVRARVLPASVDRNTVDALLGELHIAGKNEWTPFEQAAHLYRMNNQKGYSEETLAQMYRQSKGYVSAKIRAYRLMSEVLVPMAQKHQKGKHMDDLARRWSWFEEFYKKCKPNAAKENEDRVYDGKELEEKFCGWVLDGKLPQAADVRKLGDILDHKDAIKAFEKDGIDKAFGILATERPELSSKLWKQVHTAATYLQKMGLDEINELRGGDTRKRQVFNDLVKAVEHVKKEIGK
jgi:hypothetical protein